MQIMLNKKNLKITIFNTKNFLKVLIFITNTVFIIKID